jgi:hypothetical protein
MTLRAAQLSSPEAFPIVPVLLLAVPLYDTCDAITRRARATIVERRKPIAIPGALVSRVFSPDGMHVHHRLIRAGFSTRRAVALLWLLSVAFAGVALVFARSRGLGFLVLAVAVALLWLGNRVVRARVAQTMPFNPVIVAPAPGLVPVETSERAEPGRRAA